MKYIHKECGGEIKSPLGKTATCLSCGKSTDNWELSYDDKYRIHFQTKKETALGKQEEKLILTITTNGSISPQDSLSTALNFLEQTTIDIQQRLPGREK